MKKRIKSKFNVNQKLLVAILICSSYLGGSISTFARPDSSSIQSVLENIQVKGNVVDTSGEPIIGASIVVKGTTNGTVSDLDGNLH